jgi:ribonuclease R
MRTNNKPQDSLRPVTREQMESRILAFLARYPHQLFKSRDLARRLGLKSDAEVALLRDALHALDAARKLKRGRHGKFGFLSLPSVLRGTLRVTKQGLGFVRVEEFDEEVFVTPKFLGTAVDGDLVEVSLFAPGKRQNKDTRPEGEIVRILERSRTTIVGTLERSRNLYVVVPDDSRIGAEVVVAQDDLNGARPGQKVVVQVASWGKQYLRPEGFIVEVLGQAGEVDAEMKSVIREFRLPLSFPEDVIKEAENLTADIVPEEVERRLDLRNELCVTIDPEDAKDFDDAISLLPLPNGNYRLGVHIADVSYYVREGSALDREALKRGTSVYLPTMVIPMLPENLSNVICSLRPNVDRLAFSVIAEVTPKGAVKEYTIRESIIRSKRRLTYEEVMEILNTTSPDHDNDELVNMLRHMASLSAVLTRKRMKQGSIDFESPEAKFRFGADGKVIEIVKKIRLASHRLVEEFMLLANQIVAKHIGLAKKVENIRPFLYRVHDAPDPERIREVSVFVEKLGYRLDISSGVNSRALQRLLDQVRGTEVENVVNEVVLRSMAKAIYSDRNIGHFGLAFDYYAHFTSPIRRYPDLVVHRLLKEYNLFLSMERRRELLEKLPAIAEHTSARERVAMEAERTAVKVMQVEYMRRHVGDEFEGVISGVTHYGVFVEINELLVEGMIHVRDLGDDYYTYDEKHFSLIGRRTGRTIRLGDHVRVKVVRVNPEEREIDFTLVEDQSPQGKGL